MNPLPNVESFLVTALKADPTLAGLIGNRVYSAKPPASPVTPNTVVYPCVVFAFYSSSGVTAFNPQDNRVLELPSYTIKAVTEGNDYGSAHRIVNAFDTVMKSLQGAATWDGRTVQIQGWRKQNWIEYNEDDKSGVRYNHVGAVYRAFVSGV